MEVFEQMLNAYTIDSTDENNRDIIFELYNTCVKQNEQMARWPDFLGEGEPQLLANSKDLNEAKLDYAEKTKLQEKDDQVENSCLKENNKSTVCKSLSFKPLAEIFVDLDEVTPLDEGQRLLLDDDIQPCKVRLLPPTDVAMAPKKPFRPPTPINQVVLLLNPTQSPVDISCIVGYKLGDDPDPIKELIVTKDVPYV
ncbi:hypothetical protein EVAR_72941_1 [Eumeta japonica]|uniref:Uncharacterized protein n=1 Tax=Eumeta variegata TaxID=151549 RepID=A0A4C1STR4_EUMVA|nr:hypothetical protein EVAR_72941_1 [Eumeta japonica]